MAGDESILLRQQEDADVDDVPRIVHEEFVRWFDAETAGAEAAYSDIAAEFWAAWAKKPGPIDTD